MGGYFSREIHEIVWVFFEKRITHPECLMTSYEITRQCLPDTRASITPYFISTQCEFDSKSGASECNAFYSK